MHRVLLHTIGAGNVGGAEGGAGGVAGGRGALGGSGGEGGQPGGTGGCAGGGGDGEGGGGDEGIWLMSRGPQSLQSSPNSQSLYSLPGPPSSHVLSDA